MRKLMAAVAALGLLLSTVAPVTAIVGGEPDGSGHPNVGAIVGTVDGGQSYYFVCSGSLLSDDEFLVAAHCAPWEMLGLTAANVFVTFDADLHAKQPFEWGFFGPVVQPDHVIGLDLADPKSVMAGFWVPPGAAQSRNDVAVLHLDGSASAVYPGIVPVQLPEPWFLTAQAAKGGLVGHSFALAGYGFQEIGVRNPTTPIAFNGLRMASTAPFVALTKDHLSMLENGRATGEGGICMGDSGGPNFYGNVGSPLANLQLSLNVGQGGHPCDVGTFTGQRLDLPEVLAFLDPWVD